MPGFLNQTDLHTTKGIGTAGALAPAMLKTAGAKVCFCPRNNLQSLSAESSPEEPKTHHNSWCPGLYPRPTGGVYI